MYDLLRVSNICLLHYFFNSQINYVQISWAIDANFMSGNYVLICSSVVS